MGQDSSRKSLFLKEFGANLERLIYAKFTSRDAFLDKTDIYKANLHRLINGEVDPQLSTLLKIADRLGVTVKDLFPDK